MPRMSRAKNPLYIYHIMCRSISEFNLFRDDDDKYYYLGLLKKYCGKFHATVYAYCLMDSHLHLQLDPQGFDISKFMHCLNLSYVLYYNKKYKRHGHVLQGRFESRVVTSESYNLAVSAYIHNNPKDIEVYRGREHEYPFSSMGVYLGLRKDPLGIVNNHFILGLFHTTDKGKAAQRYAEFVFRQKDLATDKSIQKCLERMSVNEYRSERRVVLREYKPSEILTYLGKRLNIPSPECVYLKSKRTYLKFRAYSAFILRTLGGLCYREICKVLGNISLSGSSRLCSRGYELFNNNIQYRQIFNGILVSGILA